MKPLRASVLRATVVLCVFLLSHATARSAILDGRITFPGSDEPAVTVYVYAPATAHLYSTRIDGQQTVFHLSVPAGSYVVFAAPSEPGAPDVYGAYTHCGGSDASGVCRDHSLQSITVGPAARHVPVAITDWALDDANADALDRILGVAATPGPQPEGAPRFTEYAVDANRAGAATKPRLQGLALSADDRAMLRDAAATGPNFAGEVTAMVARCGDGCARLVLLDWSHDELIQPSTLAQINDALPCRRSESVLFRRDSRLLSVTRMRGGGIVTQYYLWRRGTASLALLAEYPRKEGEFCAIDPP